MAFFLNSATFHVRKQQLMSYPDLAMEKLRASQNNIKLLFPFTITSHRNIATGTHTYTDLSFINGEIPSKLALHFQKVIVPLGL